MLDEFQPMLSGKVKDTATLRYPCLVSPKLDGIRAVVLESVVYSRNLKPIPNKHVQRCFGRPEFNFLDGELIVGPDTAKDCYRMTNSAVMSVAGEPDVAFHAFDYFRDPTWTFQRRTEDLSDVVERGRTHHPISVVQHLQAKDETDVLLYEGLWLDKGYEGLMVRDPNAPYKFGRSTDKEGILLKLKRFTDAEARVIGFEELLSNRNEAMMDALGRTERSAHNAGMVPMNTLGALIVKDTVTGVEFNIGTGFDAATRQSIWDNRSSLKGQFVKYKSFAIGVKDKPRFPVFLGWRSEIDL